MNKRRIIISLALVALFALVGCKATSVEKGAEHKAEEEKKAEEPVISRHAALSSLPCFKCHDAGAFLNAVKPGVFSHKIHTAFDVHCNQCHTVTGHMGATINTSVCSGCHSLRVIAFEGGGMGKVSYNHDFHAKMFPCAECHPNVFPMKKGVKKIKMDDMYAGKSCGVCHNGKKAFASMECANCHKQ